MNTFKNKYTSIFMLLLLVVLSIVGYRAVIRQFIVQAQSSSSFIFTAGGDHGAPSSTDTRNSLNAIKNSGAVFSLALGDMSYGDTNNNTEPIDGTTASPWCSGTNTNQNIKLILGDTYPFQIVSGNHEDDGNDPIGDGWIKNYALCLPDRMGSTGTYGAQYYFDYPQTAPLMRVIMISPNLTVDGVTYNYSTGTDITTPRGWLIQAIDQARADNIKWVVVGMHKNCLTMGEKTCEIGTSLLNLLVQKKVDMVLQGHDHTYQRSKQLAHSATCTSIAASAVNNGCIANDGADGQYIKDQGTVFLITGNFGGSSLYALNCADTERNYFAKAMGAGGTIWDGTACTTAGVGRGIMKFTVDDNAINAQYIMTYQDTTGTAFGDSFSIIKSNVSPTSTPTPTPVPITGSSTNTFTIPADGIYTVWSRIMAPNNTSNSYMLQVDSQAPVKVGDYAISPNTWTWVDYKNGASTSKIQLSLTSGVHTLSLTNGEAGVRVEKVFFTADTSCIPVGTGTNCTAPDNTPTPTTMPPTATYTPTPTPTLIPTDTPTPSILPTSTPTQVPTSTPTPVPTTAPVSLLPIDDTFVRSDRPTATNGTATIIEIDGTPSKIAYMKFDLSPYSGRTLKSAILRLRIVRGVTAAHSVKQVASTTWNESTLTYNTRPASGAVITTFSNTKNSTFLDINLTTYMQPQLGTAAAISIDTTAKSGVDISSEESTTNKPQLILAF